MHTVLHGRAGMKWLGVPAAALRRAATSVRLWRASRHVQVVGKDLHVGARCRFWAASGIAIGDGTYLGKDVLIETNCRIGRYVLVANRVAIVGRHDHDFRTPGVPVRFGHWVGSARTPPRRREATVTIDDDVWIGLGAILLSPVHVGRGAIVAAGAVVVRDVAPYDIVAGNPAVRVGRRFATDEQIAMHEAMVRSGRFSLSERGFDHWTVEPGVAP